MNLINIYFLRPIKLKFILSIFAIGAMAIPAMASVFSVYHIGNSLTGDLFYVFRFVGERYETTQGNSYIWGYHFRGATTLPFFYNHPYDTLMTSHTGLTANSPYGAGNDAPWPEVLPKSHRDVVTMEPFGFITDQGPNNLCDNIAAVNGMIDAARKNKSNAPTRFFIYSVWSVVSLTDPNLCSTAYTAATINKSDPRNSPAYNNRDFTELLCDSVRKTNPQVCMIPAGEALYAIDRKMQHGDFDNFTTINQLHRDIIHLNSVGQNIVAWTAYATIFRKSPVGLSVDSMGNGTAKEFKNVTEIDDHDKLIMQQTIWDVVVAMNKYTNVVP
jgi:hypothetical protein